MRPALHGSPLDPASSMELLFQACVVLGGVVLLLQVLLSLFGLGGHDFEVHAPPDVHVAGGAATAEVDTSDALSLLSVRAISAGVAVFGASGLVLLPLVPGWLAALVSVAPGLLVATLTAWLTRLMLRMEVSGTLRLHDAVGQSATVYLTIPPSSVDAATHGLIHLTLQGRAQGGRGPIGRHSSSPYDQYDSSSFLLRVSRSGEPTRSVGRARGTIPVQSFPRSLSE